MEETEEKVEPELRPDVLERNWNQLMALHQERDAAIHKEIERLERLQRIAEKVHREAKATDSRLDEIERRIEEEAKRLDRLNPRDAKQNCDALNSDLAAVEEAIKTMFSDVQLLKDGRYMQTGDLHKRVQRIHQRWMSIRTLFQSRLLDVLPGLLAPVSRSSMEARLFESNEHFRYLRECSEWVRSKLVSGCNDPSCMYTGSETNEPHFWAFPPFLDSVGKGRVRERSAYCSGRVRIPRQGA